MIRTLGRVLFGGLGLVILGQTNYRDSSFKEHEPVYKFTNQRRLRA
jgi:hypothetical protein